MNRLSIISLLTASFVMLCACSSHRKADGWYPLAENPDNSVVGSPLATVTDFEILLLHQLHADDVREKYYLHFESLTNSAIGSIGM